MSEINDCQGILVRPPSIIYLTLTKSKSLIPDSLYWLVRWVIPKPEKEGEDEFSSPECSNSSDERRVLMQPQDVVHCATHARTNMPKHMAVGIAVRHIMRSKQLIIMLSRMCHCDSYDDVEAMDTSLTKDMLAMGDLFALLSNISVGGLVQEAGDNNDINEESLERTQPMPQHRSSISEGSLIQPPKPSVCADQAKRKRSLQFTVYANPSESTVHMEYSQRLPVSPGRYNLNGSNASRACIRQSV